MSNLIVLYEDNHLLAVNKPAGILVQGDRTGDPPLAEMAKLYLKDKYNKPGNVFLGTVHRLDRPVSGVVIFARTSKALSRLNLQFRDRLVKKTYWALVKNEPAKHTDILEHWLIKDRNKNITKAHKRPVNGAKEAKLEYKLVKKINDLFLLEIHPLTGRSHQIRVQLASMKCPIIGDLKYGFSQANTDGNISLHAREIFFTHPVTKKMMKITAPLPQNKEWSLFTTKLRS